MGAPGHAADVAVVGGGVIGLTSAWRLAQRGAAVVLIDPEPGRGASWAAAGMLAPVTEIHYGEESLLRLNLESAARYPGFVAELEDQTGQDTGYRRSGTLVVARDPDDNALLDELFAFQQRLGLDVQRLRSRECRALEPALHPRVRGGILVPGDHQVDNRALVTALRAAAERAGVVLCRARAAAVNGADRVAGVTLADGGSVEADHVVLAAGSATAGVAVPGLDALPVRPVKGQLLHLRTHRQAAALATHNVRGVDVYVVPRSDGRVVVGATVEERGEDVTPTAGAVYTLLRDAYELLPDVAELEFVEVAVGLRPASPDNAPLVGRAGPEGLVMATAHYRNGVLLAPLTADAVAGLISGDRASEALAAFDPGRFAPATAGDGP